jgi:L,D-peptidoglycan transpeptidase YkuD (ErfK/YbiS/YcfS/YnhG family)
VPAPTVIPLRLFAAGALASLLLIGCTSAVQAGHGVPLSSTTTSRPGTSSHPPTPRSTPKPKPAPSTHHSSKHSAPPPKPPPAPSPTSTHPAPAGLPLSASTGTARQVITVVAPSTGSTTGTLQPWTKSSSGWQRSGSAVTAHLGSQGLTEHPSESLSATPIGSFTLTQAFGSASNPGTRLAYFRTDASDWWVSDASSRYYNTHYRCSSGCPFNTGDGENLHAAGFVYTYAVVIDYNRSPVTPGAGSAFFLHVTDGSATAGCVSIPEATLVSIMQWLDPSAAPRILIGVG